MTLLLLLLLLLILFLKRLDIQSWESMNASNLFKAKEIHLNPFVTLPSGKTTEVNDECG